MGSAGRTIVSFSFIKANALPGVWGGRMNRLLILLFVLLFALLLDVQLWFLPLFLVTFIFLSNVTHDDYSFLVGLSPLTTESTCGHSVMPLILPLVYKITQALPG